MTDSLCRKRKLANSFIPCDHRVMVICLHCKTFVRIKLVSLSTIFLEIYTLLVVIRVQTGLKLSNNGLFRTEVWLLEITIGI